LSNYHYALYDQDKKRVTEFYPVNEPFIAESNQTCSWAGVVDMDLNDPFPPRFHDISITLIQGNRCTIQFAGGLYGTSKPWDREYDRIEGSSFGTRFKWNY
jgi:hypothetical protein